MPTRVIVKGSMPLHDAWPVQPMHAALDPFVRSVAAAAKHIGGRDEDRRRAMERP